MIGRAPGREARPRIVALDREGVDVVHRGAAKPAVVDPKSRWFDDRSIDAETCAGAHHGAGILGDIGLEQSEQKGGGLVDHIARKSKRFTGETVIRKTLELEREALSFGLWTSNSIDAKS